VLAAGRSNSQSSRLRVVKRGNRLNPKRKCNSSFQKGLLLDMHRSPVWPKLDRRDVDYPNIPVGNLVES
jgi:hypothetical protein